jgi:hypothetical protein
MPKHEAARTLVKSPPELWEVCSDASSLARHLEPFGEIRITRLEPETTVAWEGERASGTVQIEPSGWGTRVTLTAAAVGEEESETEAPELPPAAEPPPPPPPPLALTPAAAMRARRGLLARLLGRRGPGPAPALVESVSPLPEPPAIETPPAPPPVLEPSSVPQDRSDEPAVDTAAVLDAALDSLGSAHHRPFSRG